MNEQIQKLAEQAELYVDLYGKPWPRALSAEEADAAYKKFAELIVRECIGIVKQRWINPDEDVIAEEIKQHFGVEE